MACPEALFSGQAAPLFIGLHNIGNRPGMIEVTKLNGVKILVNEDLIETVEETPDTVLTLTNGKKILIKERRQEVKNLVKSFKRDIFAPCSDV